MVVNRFLKLNTAWSSVRWVAQLTDGGMLGWLAIQNHAKAHGMGGVVNAVDPWVLAQQNFIKAGEAAVVEAIEKAIENNALRCEGETWVLLNWDAEQGDPTGSERQKRWRDSQKERNAEPGEPDHNGRNALRNASNADEKRGEEKSVESSGEDSTNARSRGEVEPTGRKSLMKPGEFPVWWPKFQAAYPKRSGGDSWGTARGKAIVKIKAGADPEMMLAKAREYAIWCERAGIAGTNRVPMPATWINGERWLEDYGDPGKSGANARPVTQPSAPEKAFDILAEIEAREARKGALARVA